LNVPPLSKLYFLYSMLHGDCLDPGSFLVSQLHSAATSFTNRILILLVSTQTLIIEFPI